MTITGMSVSDARDVTAKHCPRPRTRIKMIIGLMIVLLAIAALAGYYIGSSELKRLDRQPPDPVESPPPSWSRLRIFHKAAVCTDAPYCSHVGRDILARNGSAVDAAIAALFCNGFLNMQSMGIGGGFFMTVYIKQEERAYSVIAREMAPGAAHKDMFNADHKKASKGPLAVGVPGELRGMWAAHQRWGSLPWADLIAPTLEMCKNGFNISKALYDGLMLASYIINDSNLRKVFYDERRKQFYPPGTLVMPCEKLCSTLHRIARNGGDELYNGSLADDFLYDLERVGSLITADDLAGYQPKITDPIVVPLTDGDILYTPPPPSSGILLGYILNILSGYNFTRNSISNTENTVLTYHRIIEAFKYAYATRTKLGDVDFLNLKKLIYDISSTTYASGIRRKISDFKTSNDTLTYGATEYSKGDNGTAHISIIAPNGDAVTVTSSINYYFGAGFTSLSTGIVLNNVMDDFSSPGITNYFGIKPSPANFIMPFKRPLSSMSPSIIVDKNGNAKHVIGASGGTKITTAIALVTIRKLWFDQSIKEAVDAPRFHHQLFPMSVSYEYGITEDVIKGLKEKGHGVSRYKERGSIICALYRNTTAIYANADFRKGGDVSGIV